MSQDGSINKFGELVVPIPTAESAQEAVNATLDSADERDMNEILNTQGDLHSVGSNEANAESIRAAAKTADEVAVEFAESALQAELDAKIDAITDVILASPEVEAMIENALAEEEASAQEDSGPGPAALAIMNRLIKAEAKIQAFEQILEAFKIRAIAAFKHAGFKF